MMKEELGRLLAGGLINLICRYICNRCAVNLYFLKVCTRDLSTPRKEYIALLDVMYQAIGDYKEAVDKLKELEERGPEIKKIERQINFISWMLAYITEVMDDES